MSTYLLGAGRVLNSQVILMDQIELTRARTKPPRPLERSVEGVGGLAEDGFVRKRMFGRTSIRTRTSWLPPTLMKPLIAISVMMHCARLIISNSNSNRHPNQLSGYSFPLFRKPTTVCPTKRFISA